MKLWIVTFSAIAVGSAEASPAPGPKEASAQVTSAAASTERPWRLHEAIGVPSWLRFGLEYRMRLEHLENDFRSSATGDASALSLRTLISAELDLAPVIVGAEFQDARAYATEATPLNNAIVDALEIAQLYARLRHSGLFLDGDSASLTLGRFTMDVGSRRLVTRNQFRNTLNSFTGIDLQWTGHARHVLRGFAVLPVMRLPSAAEELSDNRIELDRENLDALFWGVFGSAPVAGIQFETYFLALHERDGTDTPSANRRIFTTGVRAFSPPFAGRVDFDLEAMFQLGTSRASAAPADSVDLSHRALSVHATAGYKFDAVGNLRLALQYDFASGDGDPTDGVNGRFDPLFDERRADFGPVGIYGAFFRSNISAPGVRLEVAPHQTVDAFAHYQAIWLASSRDAWISARLRDATGESGTFLGHQVEARLRWNVLPKNLAFEVVGAYLIRGEFATGAPNAGSSNPAFVQTQLTGTI